MPRPNKTRSVLAEEHLARRIAAEREARGWSIEGLAKRMTDAGCPMHGSAIFKIEASEPRRRIVVDELVAFARVFGTSVEELLVPPEVAVSGEVVRRIVLWSTASDAAAAAVAEADAAWNELVRYVKDNPTGVGPAEETFRTWAEGHFGEENRDGATAYRMWKLTGDDAWADAVRAELNHG